MQVVLPDNDIHSLLTLADSLRDAALDSLTSNYPSFSFLHFTINIHPQVILSFRRKQTSLLCKYLVHTGVI